MNCGKDKMLITGGKPLMGEITVSGGKNTAVAVIPATLLSDEPSTIENLPDIEDVHALIEILQLLGAKTEYVPDQYLKVYPKDANGHRVPYQYTNRLRASYYLLGALLGRIGRAEVAYPGGCDIGSRPIDQHLKGFVALGATIEDRGGMVLAKADHLTGSDIFFDMVTVGATINVMLAAAKAEGTTVIYNAAKEPHIVDLANFLNSMGARIKLVDRTVLVEGVRELYGAPVTVTDLRAGAALIVAGLMAKGTTEIYETGFIDRGYERIEEKLRSLGADIRREQL